MDLLSYGRPSRRAALGLLSGALASGAARPGWAAAQGPVLATPAQGEAEQALLRLEQAPRIKTLKATLEAELAATPKGKTAVAGARIPEAVAQWTRSAIFKVLAAEQPAPAILWSTDDTPRTWLGRTIGGVGTAGDNPDNIYRLAYVDGGGRYEILGQVDPKVRPAQFTLEIVRGDGALPTRPATQTAGHADMGGQVAMITDKDLEIGPDGRFRILLGGPETGPGRFKLEPGPLTFGFRDTLSDWRQRPNRLQLRRLDPAPPRIVDPAALEQKALDAIGPYVRFWSGFGGSWFGGLQPNAASKPIPRDGGWGYVAGLSYRLQPDEALVIITTRGQAAYTGFQLVDPWMIAADARRNQVCLNLAQAAPDQDGRFTHVISPTDPGVANWLDTAGIDEGFGVIRWQGLPQGEPKAPLLQDVRLVKLAEVAKLEGVRRLSPAERRAQLAARTPDYETRLG